MEHLSFYDIVQTYFELERKFGYGRFGDVPYTRDDLENFAITSIPNSTLGIDLNDIEDYWFKQSEAHNFSAALDKHRQFVGDLLEAKYDYESAADAKKSLAVSVLFLLSGLLLAVPSIDVFLAVVRDILT